MQTRFQLRYRGPAVEAGRMDVYDAAANMIAFSEFAVAAAKAAYGEAVDARAEVAGFGRGSFVTDLIVNVGGPVVTLLTTGSPKELLGVVVESIKVWKHLNGQQPKSIEYQANNQVTIENNNGQVINVNAQSLSIVFQDKPSEAVQRFVRQALEQEGMDAVSVDAEQDGEVAPVFEVTQRESTAFVDVAPDEALTDNVHKTALVIEAPVFKDGNKWRFSDGSASFYADIADEDFLSRVDGGEPFAKGDSLIVELQVRQHRRGDRLIAEKTIRRVLEHRRRPTQGGMFDAR